MIWYSAFIEHLDSIDPKKRNVRSAFDGESRKRVKEPQSQSGGTTVVWLPAPWQLLDRFVAEDRYNRPSPVDTSEAIQ